jgi:hypothetical protein
MKFDIFDIVKNLVINRDKKIINKNVKVNTIPKYLEILEKYNINLKNALKFTHIVIHHSATVDTVLNDFDSIKYFHTHWKDYKRGINISEEEAKKLLQDPNYAKYIKPPFQDIAYYFLFEFIDKNKNKLVEKDEYVFHIGRSLNMTGAGAIGFNGYKNDLGTGIHICYIGNYDLKSPSQELLDFSYPIVKSLMLYFNIPIQNIIGHRETFLLRKVPVEKSCPGKMWDCTKYRKELNEF